MGRIPAQRRLAAHPGVVSCWDSPQGRPGLLLHNLIRVLVHAVAGRSALHRPLLSAGLALVLLADKPVVATDLNAAVQASSAQLRRAWAMDPGTASLPFPEVVLLPPGVVASGACSLGAPARKPAPRAMACASSSQVLLQHDLLSASYSDYGTPAVAYWIAVGLAELIQPKNTDLSPSASNLQVNCLAGVLLGAGSVPNSENVVKAAGRAYGDLVNAVVGNTEQRAYAVISGYGGTPSGCSAGEMSDLAQGKVPEPGKLGTLAAALRANTSFHAAYRSQCQPVGKKTCPRTTASSLVPTKATRP